MTDLKKQLSKLLDEWSDYMADLESRQMRHSKNGNEHGVERCDSAREMLQTCIDELDATIKDATK